MKNTRANESMTSMTAKEWKSKITLDMRVNLKMV